MDGVVCVLNFPVLLFSSEAATKSQPVTACVIDICLPLSFIRTIRITGREHYFAHTFASLDRIFTFIRHEIFNCFC